MSATSGSIGTKLGVAAITLLLAIYLAFTVRQSWLLVIGGDPVTVAMGIALIVLPILAAVFIARELLFGVQAERLLRRMIDEDALPADDLPRRPSGAPDRAAADAEFPRWQAEVTAAPQDWHAWYRLGLAYKASGDTKRARAAVRQAIKLEAAQRR